jgi:MFS family permease
MIHKVSILPFVIHIRNKMWKNEIRESLPLSLLLINSVVWFSVSWFVIEDLIKEAPFNNVLLVSSSYFGALLLSAVIGATLLSKKLRGKRPLLSWVLLGAVACVLSAVLAPERNSINLVFVSLPLGALAGLGIPTCLALFSKVSRSMNRGRYGGIAFFLIQAFTVLIFMPVSSANMDYQFLVLAAWRLVGVLCVFFWMPHEGVAEERQIRLLGIIRERTFFLYFVPWFLFAIVNFVEQPLLEHYFGVDSYNLYMMAGILITSVSALLGGALCDFKGRKVSGVLGFILLGIGYAFLTLLEGTKVSQILWTLFVGVAWGLLYVTFVLVVWGDISEGKTREKYYLLGGMPFLLSNLISVLVKPFVEIIPIAASFSLASFFLFLAILPMLYAPETLSEKVLKKRELKNYIEKAQKEATKAMRNEEEENKQCENENDEWEIDVNQEDSEKATELAEKYY